MEKTITRYVNGQKLTFDIEMESKVEVPIWYGKCRENGRYAWIDRDGVQLEHANGDMIEGTRVLSSTRPNKVYITYDYDPMYPDECIPEVHFHDTLEAAKAYEERIEKQYDGDICVVIYEAEVK